MRHGEIIGGDKSSEQRSFKKKDDGPLGRLHRDSQLRQDRPRHPLGPPLPFCNVAVILRGIITAYNIRFPSFTSSIRRDILSESDKIFSPGFSKGGRNIPPPRNTSPIFFGSAMSEDFTEGTVNVRGMVLRTLDDFSGSNYEERDFSC